MLTRALFCQFDNEIYPKIRGRHVRLGNIGASARPMLLIILMCNIHIVNWGLNVNLSLFLSIWQWNIPPKSGVGMFDWVILEPLLAQWRRIVASLKATNLLHLSILAVSYRRIAMAIETASKVGVFCIVVLLIVTLAAAGAIKSE